MNKKAEMGGLGIMLIAFVGVIVALSIYISIGGYMGQLTSTNSAVNVTYTAPANGVALDLTGQELISTPIITNATSGATVPSTNYTIAEGLSTTGVKRIIYTGAASEYAGQSVNASYTYGEQGYIESSGGRALALLIPVLAALAIIVVALSPTLRSGIMEMLGR